MDSLLGPAGYFGIAAAHRRGLFQLLDGKRLTAAEICEALALKPRPVNALLAVAASVGLLELSGERYALTEQAEDYLLPASPTYGRTRYSGDIPAYSGRRAASTRSSAARRPAREVAPKAASTRCPPVRRARGRATSRYGHRA